jgi:hypothetical protein
VQPPPGLLRPLVLAGHYRLGWDGNRPCPAPGLGGGREEPFRLFHPSLAATSMRNRRVRKSAPGLGVPHPILMAPALPRCSLIMFLCGSLGNRAAAVQVGIGFPQSTQQPSGAILSLMSDGKLNVRSMCFITVESAIALPTEMASKSLEHRSDRASKKPAQIIEKLRRALRI